MYVQKMIYDNLWIVKIIYGRFKHHVQVKLLYQALQSNSVHNYYSTLITIRYRKIFWQSL